MTSDMTPEDILMCWHVERLFDLGTDHLKQTPRRLAAVGLLVIRILAGVPSLLHSQCSCRPVIIFTWFVSCP